jgi:hypothetical protein
MIYQLCLLNTNPYYRVHEYKFSTAGGSFESNVVMLEKAEIFRMIEPYLTFLNVNQLERQGANIQSKIEELEELNQSFSKRDKMKDDAIAQLSDQLMTLAIRLQEIERNQQVKE